MKQYLDLAQRILDTGTLIYNKRTGKNTLTVINADLEYDVANNIFPLVTTRKVIWKSAIAEMIGHLRGYTSAADYRNLGCNVWTQNANFNNDWLKNPNRKYIDDMGFVYGAVARNYPVYKPEFNFSSDNDTIDLVKKVYSHLSNRVDDRGEIITFYHPGSFHLGCLRPCLFQHHFSILDDTLYLNSYQRSCDVPLGLCFNMIQVYFLLAIMAHITNLKPGKAYHKIINAHIYEDQIELMKMQCTRQPYSSPQFFIDKDIKTLNDLDTWVIPDNFTVQNYLHHDPIKFPFSV